MLQNEASQAQEELDQWRPCQHDEECPSQTDKFGHGSHPCLTGREGMGKEGWDHSPLEGEWTHLVGEISHA
jgi:hypothetical protein